MTQEALKLALEALENAREVFISIQEFGIQVGASAKDVRLGERFIADIAIVAIKEALAQPEQEPVAWMDADGNVSDNNDHNCFPIPLYTTPPQRTWVGLTDEEIWDTPDYEETRKMYRFAKAIEAKLKERNS